MYKKIMYISAFALAGFLVACTADDNYDEKYDIQYKVANIFSFSPETALIGDTIEITGENLDDKTLQVFIGADLAPIVKGSATLSNVKVVIPRTAVTAKIKVLTYFTADSRNNPFSAKEFIPKYPAVKITLIPDTLFATQAFKITGENMDLITKVAIADTIISITNTSATEASFDFSKVTFAKPIVPINFVTRNKDNFTDREVVVMPDLPKIKILAQFPDAAEKGKEASLVFDRPDFGKFITKVSIESIKDTTFTITTDPTTGVVTKEIKKINLNPDVVLDYKVNVNKISFTVPNIATTGNVKITGSYKLISRYQVVLK